MEDIIKSVTDAEEKAREIVERAQTRAATITENAAAKADEILKACDGECKLYRETAVKKAEKDGNIAYGEALSAKRAEAAEYADGALKRTDSTVTEIVRRITRGSC